MADATATPSRVWPFILGAVAGFAGAYLFVLPPRTALNSSSPRLPVSVTPVATPVKREYKLKGAGYYVLLFEDPPSKKGRKPEASEGPFRDIEWARAVAFAQKRKWKSVSIKKLKQEPVTPYTNG